MRVALIGATGLVGAALGECLAATGDDLHRLQRREGGGAGQVHVADPGAWPEIVSRLRPDAAISTLGTTLKVAGSRAAFHAVDFDMVVDFARAARAAGATRMIAVSSVGADAGACAFYLRTKGEMEAALTALGFERLDILRPGLLRGDRRGDHRTGERIGAMLSPLLNLLLQGSLDRFRAIDAEVVAQAIAKLLALQGSGAHIHHNRKIRRLAAA
ncbi:NAD-dependent epimerase/dehydratase family protein [Allosphingosinicella deserti]|uniref:NAD-dependent dehydratase n=1 Tax=Allosphingosinicella deserti TaxID=2116704 RepID=A0A2P7QK50_9SPHN|nr:NAD-dependent epimerase/dehydratase family protein [Sphingomonas deserti]PSJ38385.1 NAD-dependent dehydratase [Sphingomonas deserti]